MIMGRDGMMENTALLVAASGAITLFAGPLVSVTERAAESSANVAVYREAVLGTSADDPGRDLDPTTREDTGADHRRDDEPGTDGAREAGSDGLDSGERGQSPVQRPEAGRADVNAGTNGDSAEAYTDAGGDEDADKEETR